MKTETKNESQPQQFLTDIGFFHHEFPSGTPNKNV